MDILSLGLQEWPVWWKNLFFTTTATLAGGSLWGGREGKHSNHSNGGRNRKAHGDNWITAVDWAVKRIYFRDCRADNAHLIIYRKYTLYLSQCLVATPVFIKPHNLCGSSWPGGITSSHPLATLLEAELLCLTNSFRLLQEEWRSIDHCLSAFLLPPFHLNGWQGYEYMTHDG